MDATSNTRRNDDMMLSPSLINDTDSRNISVEYEDDSMDITMVTRLSMVNIGITSVSPLMSVCTKLYRVDLKGNNLSMDCSDISVLTNVTWLRLSDNQLVSLNGLESCDRLKMLDVSNNRVADVSVVHQLSHLKALIAKGNEVKAIPFADSESHAELDTMILSHNQLESLDGVRAFPLLAKVSASHNRIQEIPAEIGQLRNLAELRLNSNQIARVPGDVLAQCTRLNFLDLGNNLLESFDDLAPLTKLKRLRNLNLRGNPVAKQQTYATRIVGMFDNVRVFDGRKRDHFIKSHRVDIVAAKQLVAAPSIEHDVGDHADDEEDDGVDFGVFKEKAMKVSNKDEKKKRKKRKRPHIEQSSKSAKSNEAQEDNRTGVVSVNIVKRKRKAATKVRKVDLLAPTTNEIGTGAGASSWD